MSKSLKNIWKVIILSFLLLGFSFVKPNTALARNIATWNINGNTNQGRNTLQAVLDFMENPSPGQGVPPIEEVEVMALQEVTSETLDATLRAIPGINNLPERPIQYDGRDENNNPIILLEYSFDRNGNHYLFFYNNNQAKDIGDAIVLRNPPPREQIFPYAFGNVDNPGNQRGYLAVQTPRGIYYSVHASSGEGRNRNNDAEKTVTRILERNPGLTPPGRTPLKAFILGDFNRDITPSGNQTRDQAALDAFPNQGGSLQYPITGTFNARTPTPSSILDYMFTDASLAFPGGTVLNGLPNAFTPNFPSDHFPVLYDDQIAGGVAKKAHVKSMPLGASITQGIGSSTKAGYRFFYYGYMTRQPFNVTSPSARFKTDDARSVTDDTVPPDIIADSFFDEVGRQDEGTMTDPDNEAYPGWRIGQIARQSQCAVPAYKPSLVTLIAGTNDMVQNFQIAGAPKRLGYLVDQILKDSPKVTVLVQGLPPNRNPEYDARITVYNEGIKAEINRRATAGAHVMFLPTPLEVADIGLKDGTHPNDTGYEKIAESFFEATNIVADAGWLQEPDPNVNFAWGCNDRRWKDHGVKFNKGFGAGNRYQFGDVTKDKLPEYWVLHAGQTFESWINFGPTGTGPKGNILSGPGWKTFKEGYTYKQTGEGKLFLSKLTSDNIAECAYVSDRKAQTLHDNYTVDITVYASDTSALNGQGVCNKKLGTTNIDVGEKIITEQDPSDRPGNHPPLPPRVTSLPTPRSEFADLTGSGRADYLRIFLDGTTQAWLNKGLGSDGTIRWQGSSAERGPGEGTGITVSSKVGKNILWADLNGDGQADLIAVTPKGGARAWLNTGFDAQGKPGLTYIGVIAEDKNIPPANVRFVDLNGDRKADLLKITKTGVMHIWLNDMMVQDFTPKIKEKFEEAGLAGLDLPEDAGGEDDGDGEVGPAAPDLPEDAGGEDDGDGEADPDLP